VFLQEDTILTKSLGELNFLS